MQSISYLYSDNLYTEHIVLNARLDDAKAAIRTIGRNTNNPRYADDHPYGRKWRTKEPLDESKREWKCWLKVHKTKIMVSGLITSWEIDGEIMGTLTDFIFLSSKITADGDCSHEIKRCLLLERKAMADLGSILKSKDITLLTKVCRIKAMAFPVVMYGCESWTIKKAEWCFWIVVLEKTVEILGLQGKPTSQS